MFHLPRLWGTQVLRCSDAPCVPSRCPPCRQFTPKLRDVYHSLQASGKRFEVIFISSDRSELEFKVGPLPANMRALRNPFTVAYAVCHMHAGVFRDDALACAPLWHAAAACPSGAALWDQWHPGDSLGEKGVVINANARSAVLRDHATGGAEFPWRGQEDADGG